MDKFIIKTLKKYLPYCSHISIRMVANKQTATFIKDFRLAAVYSQTILIKKQGSVNWILNSQNLDIIYTLPLKGHAFFYIKDVTTQELKKSGWVTHHLMINCESYKPDKTLKSELQIIVDSQTIKRGHKQSFVKKYETGRDAITT